MALLAITITTTTAAPSSHQYPLNYLDAADQDTWTRFLPVKNRRAPLDGFEDMSGFLRTIDGIQKPRFG
uniref:Uncharacterized protein n=1 Tax=Caenorhabditis japonica TaxID=281687 RepID=A0A8R1I6T9_CAEJA